MKYLNYYFKYSFTMIFVFVIYLNNRILTHYLLVFELAVISTVKKILVQRGLKTEKYSSGLFKIDCN